MESIGLARQLITIGPRHGRATAKAERMEFDQLYERHARSTFAFFMRRSGDASTAADLNQELYLRLAQSMDKFEGRCSWRTWIFTIARNVLSEARSERWQALADRSVSLDTEEFRESIELELLPDATEESADLLLVRYLKICLAKLDDMAKVIVVAHYFQGVTLRELTETFSLANASGSRAILIKAQRQLRKCLSAKGGAS